MNDVTIREQIRRARGLCKDHTWALTRHRAALGAAIITRDVLQCIMREQDGELPHDSLATLSPQRAQDKLSAPQTAATSAALVGQPSPKAECPVYVQVCEMEDIYLRISAAHLLGPEGLLGAYRSPDGLCLPHLRQALD